MYVYRDVCVYGRTLLTICPQSSGWNLVWDCIQRSETRGDSYEGGREGRSCPCRRCFRGVHCPRFEGSEKGRRKEGRQEEDEEEEEEEEEEEGEE